MNRCNGTTSALLRRRDRRPRGGCHWIARGGGGGDDGSAKRTASRRQSSGIASIGDDAESSQETCNYVCLSGGSAARTKSLCARGLLLTATSIGACVRL